FVEHWRLRCPVHTPRCPSPLKRQSLPRQAADGLGALVAGVGVGRALAGTGGARLVRDEAAARCRACRGVADGDAVVAVAQRAHVGAGEVEAEDVAVGAALAGLPARAVLAHPHAVAEAAPAEGVAAPVPRELEVRAPDGPRSEEHT